MKSSFTILESREADHSSELRRVASDKQCPTEVRHGVVSSEVSDLRIV